MAGRTTLLSLAMLGSLAAGQAIAHDGPDPIAHWSFQQKSLHDGALHARLGPAATVHGEPQVITDQYGESLFFDGTNDRLTIADDLESARKFLPKRSITVSAWVSINTPQPWGGIIGCLQDNGESEQGWILGYHDTGFYFALASEGSDDGDGKMTYLKGTTQYEIGRLYHIVATYDGEEMRLYVNGALDTASREQSGDILYPEHAPYVMAGYVDSNESYFHHGKIRDVALYDIVAKPKWVTHEFEHNSELVNLDPYIWVDPELYFKVEPYLQFVTKTSMTVMWETSRSARSAVYFGETAECDQLAIKGAPRGQGPTIHEIRLTSLKPQTGYFYRIQSTDSLGRELQSEVRTFQTAVHDDVPFAFAVISDTQDSPKVVKAISDMAWAQRPHFVLHPGDLVSTGTNKAHWTDHFFPNMQPLISRVAFFPVLGNHEQNAAHYYDYMSLPDPEYYYDYRYGNAHFFMIDTNKNVDPESEQYRWLEARLKASDARWKFVCHHHPAYSSDENDYGDMWEGKSTHGDTRVRQLTTLYDTYGVDIVWNGHIHSYERTWPVQDNRVVEPGNGTIYMITGGAGGGLETPGPIRPWFQNNVRHGHHYCMVYINGNTLEFKAFDLEGRLFDVMTVQKDEPPANPAD